MAKITIKNTKSENESAYKTGQRLPAGKGTNWDIANPGALTGKYGDGKKFNTMNLPIRGTNLQVSIGADKEKEFDNISSIDAIYMESASAVINEDKGSSDSPTPSGNHYDWTLDVNTETMEFFVSNYVEGQQLQEDDTATVTLSNNLVELFDDPTLQKEYNASAEILDIDIIGTVLGSFSEANNLYVAKNTPFIKIGLPVTPSGIGLLGMFISNNLQGLSVGICTIYPDGDIEVEISAKYLEEYNVNYIVSSNLERPKIISLNEYVISLYNDNGYEINESALNKTTEPFIYDGEDLYVASKPDEFTNTDIKIESGDMIVCFPNIAINEAQNKVLDFYITGSESEVGHKIRDI